MKTHLYQRDPAITAHRPDAVPCTCGMPKANRVHKLKAVTAEAKAYEHRRIGERE